MKYGKRYSIIDLAESMKPGADLRLAKFERGLSGMMEERYLKSTVVLAS